jgi:hypothetical protein
MNNPIIPHKGVCAPHVHVFDGRAYLYASHDRSPASLALISLMVKRCD